MRRECLFDPNHLIDNLGYGKHLKNCQSKLKKDWRPCKYDQQHWCIYNQIDFHQKFECTENPLFKTNPKAFRDRREQELGRRQFEAKKKKNKNSQSVLNGLKDNSQSYSAGHSISGSQASLARINFGQISMIQNETKSTNPVFNSSSVNHMNDHTILYFEKALNLNENLQPSRISEDNQSKNVTAKTDKSMTDKVRKEKQLFEKGISSKEKKLWTQPDFKTFEEAFRRKWKAKKQKELIKEDEKEKSFEQQQELEITIRNIPMSFSQIS